MRWFKGKFSLFIILLVLLISVVQFSFAEDPYAVQRGEGSAEEVETIEPVAVINICITPRCKQIDQVWESIRGLLPRISEEAKTGVYNPSDGWSSAERDVSDLSTTSVTSPEKNKLNEIYNNYKTHIDLASQRYNIEKSLIVAIIMRESTGNPNAESSAGAKGLMQLTSITIQDINNGASSGSCGDIAITTNNVADPAFNIPAGTCYLNYLNGRFQNDVKTALAAYNAVPGTVRGACGQENFDSCKSGLPAETQNYVPQVLDFKLIFESSGVKSEIVRIVNQEYTNWGRGTLHENDASAAELLNKYAGVVNQAPWSSSRAWSAIFISYVVETAGINFPSSTFHSTYFSSLRDNPRSCRANRMNIENIKIGDIVCKCRDTGCPNSYDDVAPGQLAHCDIVVSKDGNLVEAIGGNLDDTVKKKTLNLDDNDYFGFISCN